MTVDLDIWHAGHAYTMYIKFEGQGHLRDFAVTGESKISSTVEMTDRGVVRAENKADPNSKL